MSDDDDDQLLNALLQDTTDSNKLPFALPSQRKKEMQKKRPPKIASNENKVKIDAFSLDSDQLSPPPTSTASKPQEVVQKQQPPKSLIELEANILKYAEKSIEFLKNEFIAEFKYQMSQTAEEDSAINAFVLGMPNEINEVVNEELQQYHRPSLSNATSINASIDAHLALVRKILQVAESNTPVSSLSPEKVNELDQLITKSNYNIDSNLKMPLGEFKIERSEKMMSYKIYFDHIASASIPSPNLRSIEVESLIHQLDVEEELFQKKKLRMTNAQNNYRQLYLENNNFASQNNMSEIQNTVDKINASIAKQQYQPFQDSAESLQRVLSSELQTIKTSIDHLRSICIMKKSSKKKQKQVIQQRQEPKPKQITESDEFLCDILERIRAVQNK
ncbi:hypothetical protein TVAG_436900 [Trichomonas vaginalis G3]|uniref:Uncharacterized protein n=1 Tax=Trichomonas vaginalis (strain ATCC PRA-98 / G3) TaxID=412133 RepID=A2DFD8_TRIV3|nr:hypothetical protein TVAGG3_0565260 [Trichomonas vaginalis G3]EAY20866.1 hypothetical protein TVAG_436900 [Trichomonas vaginalis G3]KAI5521524.1 hypothetical protein TVAGG3_0565260 [Trichomonas vaginalis G3]|eukprot:XP_001581852.1 hypothetical protein [Trichomonas vaginalis G3]